MKKGDVLKSNTEIKNNKYNLEIKCIESFPVKIAIFYQNLPIWIVSMQKNEMILEMFSKPSDAEKIVSEIDDGKIGETDEAFNEYINFIVDFLMSEIEQGFVNRFIDEMQKQKVNA